MRRTQLSERTLETAEPQMFRESQAATGKWRVSVFSNLSPKMIAQSQLKKLYF
jgi:hypothetical protein